MSKKNKKIIETETVGTEELNMSLKEVVELTGISIKTEPITED